MKLQHEVCAVGPCFISFSSINRSAICIVVIIVTVIQSIVKGGGGLDFYLDRFFGAPEVDFYTGMEQTNGVDFY